MSKGNLKDIKDYFVMLRPTYKFWFETKEGYIFGKGIFELLDKIQEVGTLSGAAEALKMSYRYAWGIIKKTENRIKKPLLDTRKGGKFGGGGATLTPTGYQLIETYQKFRSILDEICKDEIKLG